jgi:hypothetical protein
MLLFISGCYSIVARKEFKAKLKTCYSGEESLSGNEKIDLNGYYLMFVKGDFSSGPPNTPYYKTYDSLPHNIFFFKDGIYLEDFHILLDDNPANVQNYFNNIYEANVDTVTSKFHATYWGSYKIVGDTIIVQYFFIGSLNAGWFGWNIWYKIIDKQTIKLIFAYPLREDISERELQVLNFNTNRFSTGKLVPLEKLPSSDSWLKKEKWFWCDENQWRAYMESNGYKIKRKDRLKK